MQTNELIFYHAFSCVGGFGPQKFKKLLAHFGSLESAWDANRDDLLTSNIGPAITKSFLEKRSGLSPEKLFSELREENIAIIVQDHESYPPQLKEIPSAPAIIYARGNLEILKNKSVAVVGSRKFTEYGERVTQNLCRDLVQAGLTIVSGLAFGIDAIAHRATLESGGTTIAVLGTGIDDETIYPRDNFNLAKNILDAGYRSFIKVCSTNVRSLAEKLGEEWDGMTAVCHFQSSFIKWLLTCWGETCSRADFSFTWYSGPQRRSVLKLGCLKNYPLKVLLFI